MQIKQKQFPQLALSPDLTERLAEILETQGLTLPESLTKFQAIALPLILRGFYVTPVRPDAKAGAAGNWQYWQFRTVKDVLTRYVEKYADCNGGVVSRKGLRESGNLIFIDNDGGIPGDIIAKLFIKTYTVASRPDGDHRHFYYRETAYSVKRFGRDAKTMNIRDVTQIVPSPSGGKMYRTLFDVKGIGGASLVVAPGSTKPNGNVYAVVNDAPVADIPDALVDWILNEQKKYRVALTRVMQANYKAKQRAAKIPSEERAALRELGHSDGFDIFPVDRHNFTLSRAMKHARRGVTGEALVSLLVADVIRYVEEGKEYCSKPRGLESIRGIARNAERITEAERAEEMLSFYNERRQERYFTEGTTIYDAELSVPLRKERIKEIVAEFPDKLTCEDADQRLTDGMNLVGLEPFDKRRDKNALSLVRRELGFEVGRKYWVRVRRVESAKDHRGCPPPSASPNIGSRDGHVPRVRDVKGHRRGTILE